MGDINSTDLLYIGMTETQGRPKERLQDFIMLLRIQIKNLLAVYLGSLSTYYFQTIGKRNSSNIVGVYYT